MRNSIKTCALAAVIFLGASLAHVQGATNVAMVTHFALSGFTQSGDSSVAPVKITNKDILNALNDTGRFSFGSGAQIIFLSFEGQLPSIAIREGSGANAVTTDVSDYFSIDEPGEVHTANHVSYAIYVYNFDNRNGTSFSVGGMTTLHAGTITGPGIAPLFRDRILTSSVSGSGTMNGATTDFRGTVSGGSAKAEVD